jgi:glutamate N-acetyltransferase/amino-acid N-acetyltransferase
MLDREHLRSGNAQAVVVNSGNANCANGEPGMKAAMDMAAAVADELSLSQDHVLVASTGVIGVRFPIERVKSSVPGLVSRLTAKGVPDLARAIMTTDTRPKMGGREGAVGVNPYNLVAVAKGAGMIRPDMATMLCFAFTDADVSDIDLQPVLQRAVDVSFNCISIDGDTSTNDTVVLMGNGASGAKIHTTGDQLAFQRLLDDLFQDLARQMVRDGEGVTKVVDLKVRGARSDAEARAIVDAIGHSPLVKTAFFGEDANWGRIIAAAGRAGVHLDPDCLDLYFGDAQMVKNGTGCGSDAEQKATVFMKQPEFQVTLDLKLGHGQAGLLTCDFSIDYVKINADYRS